MSCASPYFMAKPPEVLTPVDIYLGLGKRGSQKSNRAKALAERSMKAGQRVLAVDPHDEWSQKGRPSDQVKLGPLRQRYEAWELLTDLSLLEDPDLCAAAVPGSRDPEQWAKVFVPIMEMVQDVGDITLVLEEMGSWGLYCVNQLNALALNSRHSRVAVIGVAQRAFNVSLTFRSQATHINSGLQTEPADLKALEEVAGKDFAEAVRQLERGQWCHWRDDMGGSRPSPTRKKKP